MRTAIEPQQLRARSVAYALLARILGPDPAALTDDATVDALRAALAASDADGALARIAATDRRALPDLDELAGRWVRFFDLGRVAPYEGSNILGSAGGVTPRLADIAGFYRAFGMAVVSDRPDHVVAQLEFLALSSLAEADAIERGDAEHTETCAGATRCFLRDHIGGWIDAWAARVGEVDGLEPWFPYAAAAADLVRTEAVRRNVIPLFQSAALVADAGVAADDEASVTCEEESADPG